MISQRNEPVSGQVHKGCRYFGGASAFAGEKPGERTPLQNISAVQEQRVPVRVYFPHERSKPGLPVFRRKAAVDIGGIQDGKFSVRHSIKNVPLRWQRHGSVL